MVGRRERHATGQKDSWQYVDTVALLGAGLQGSNRTGACQDWRKGGRDESHHDGGRYFASASRCMALRSGTKLRTNIEEHLAVATMAPIGVKHVGGIKGRALLLRPQRVNTALYVLGMSIKEGKKQRAL